MADKSKQKNDFKKRKFKTSSVGSLVPTLLKKMGGAAEAKKSASIIRVMNHWGEIIGNDMVEKTMPIKIGFKKQKNRITGEQETIRTLKLKAEGAFATAIAMREAIICQRLNTLFGAEDFGALIIEQGTVKKPKDLAIKKEIKKYDIDLNHIDDPILKERLNSLGQAVMNKAD
jgi:hypothetical protein